MILPSWSPGSIHLKHKGPVSIHLNTQQRQLPTLLIRAVTLRIITWNMSPLSLTVIHQPKFKALLLIILSISHYIITLSNSVPPITDHFSFSAEAAGNHHAVTILLGNLNLFTEHFCYLLIGNLDLPWKCLFSCTPLY